MKTIKELGISPTPWQKELQDYYWVDDVHRSVVADCCRDNDDIVEANANARLVAAAPDLYEALREAVEKYCAICESRSKDGDRCLLPDNACFQRWRKALEKAGGAEWA